MIYLFTLENRHRRGQGAVAKLLVWGATGVRGSIAPYGTV